MSDKKIKLAISQCLSGANVRYDGQSKSHDFVVQHLSEAFDLKPICPEIEIGLSVPRKPVHLVYEENVIRVLQVDDPSIEYTEQLKSHAKNSMTELNEICGYVFKARSPSCGVNTTEVKNLSSPGSGVFADAVVRLYPYLPIVDESALDDDDLRDQFLENVFCYAGFMANVKNFVDDFGLRWVLRTGKNIEELESAKLSELQSMYFCSMNKLLSKIERICRTREAIVNNPELFSCVSKDIEEMIAKYSNSQLGFLQFQLQLQRKLQRSLHFKLKPQNQDNFDEFLNKNDCNAYRLDISQKEIDIRGM